MLIFHTGLSRDFDGPGERIVFYLKGCNFHCDWCASPESISAEPEMLYYPERNNDAACSSCPRSVYKNSRSIDRALCRGCSGRPCINIWHNPAFEWAGENISPEKVLQKAEEMRDFTDGVTFGGGEPTLQFEELEKCCSLLKSAGIHTAVESNASTVNYPGLIGKTDLLYSDLKTLDPETASCRMKADISMVKQNLLLAAAEQQDFILRIPVIRDVNTSEQAQNELLEFCLLLDSKRPDGQRLRVELLRQHHLGEPKYKALGKEYRLRGTPEISRGTVETFFEKFCKADLPAQIFY